MAWCWRLVLIKLTLALFSASQGMVFRSLLLVWWMSMLVKVVSSVVCLDVCACLPLFWPDLGLFWPDLPLFYATLPLFLGYLMRV